MFTEAIKTFHLIQKLSQYSLHDANGSYSSPQDCVKKLLKACLAAIKATHGSYFYPFKGIVYFTKQPSLVLGPTKKSLIWAGFISLIITLVMFIFTYLPQMAVISLFVGPFIGAVTAFFVVLSEIYLLVSIMIKSVLFERIQKQVFYSVLKKQQIDGDSKVVTKLIPEITRAFTISNIFQYIITLPLNFVPVVGNIIFFMINGLKTATSYHSFYFQYKGLSKSEREKFIQDREPSYYAFGSVCILLGMIPVVNIFFLLTNSIGAALWAIDMEKSRQRELGSSDSFKEANVLAKNELELKQG